MTKAEQQRLQHVQNSLMRSIFGGMKRGQMLAVLRAEAGWCSVELLVAESILGCYRFFLGHGVSRCSALL
jgi:hypothetical protein